MRVACHPVSGGWILAHGEENMEQPSSGLATCREGNWMDCRLGGRQQQKSELVHEVERSRLDTVGLTLSHCFVSETRILERAWTLSCLELCLVRGAR